MKAASVHCPLAQDVLTHTGSEEDNYTVLGTEEIQHKRMEECDRSIEELLCGNSDQEEVDNLLRR